MKFFIEKIFNEEAEGDKLVHLQFQKFSKGNFTNKAVIIAKNLKGKFNINTTPEYANEFVRFLSEKLGPKKTRVSGVIISTQDLYLDYQDKKQFMGIKKYVIEKEMSGNEILELCDKFPGAFFALSFKTEDSELKIKPKPPRTKQSFEKGATLKVNFCNLKTTNKEILNSLIFDPEAKCFKKIEITHDFIINEIIIPDEIKASVQNDFGKLRELALRKGKVVRKLNIDGKEYLKEKNFIV